METNTIIVSDSDNPTTVFGVHGGDGTLLWKRMSTGSHLHADWDGFEWVALRPGDRAGLHTHAHTEELFYFISGTGRVVLDGNEYRVESGSVVLTPLGSTHSVENDGNEDLAYIVVEVFPPSISGALPPRRPTDESSS